MKVRSFLAGATVAAACFLIGVRQTNYAVEQAVKKIREETDTESKDRN